MDKKKLIKLKITNQILQTIEETVLEVIKTINSKYLPYNHQEKQHHLGETKAKDLNVIQNN